MERAEEHGRVSGEERRSSSRYPNMEIPNSRKFLQISAVFKPPRTEMKWKSADARTRGRVKRGGQEWKKRIESMGKNL